MHSFWKICDIFSKLKNVQEHPVLRCMYDSRRLHTVDDRQRSSDRNSIVYRILYCRTVRNSEKLSPFWMSVSSNFGPYLININLSTVEWRVYCRLCSTLCFSFFSFSALPPSQYHTARTSVQRQAAHRLSVPRRVQATKGRSCQSVVGEVQSEPKDFIQQLNKAIVLHVMCISEPKASMLWKLAAPFGSWLLYRHDNESIGHVRWNQKRD